ncbi:hypothetical protein DPMN_158970 [Dreissena polymorpha]|uniref:Uncharacterized protein n=1 Tax=Dreissena polymorpha TaxID=45954 RepID=A0A9D4INQ5_DREPO|nr:hypothetical protein DPMN_158970 [Dreissena polymorpha]
MFAVPITTLKDRVMGRVDIDTLRSGPHTLFTLDQEECLASHLQTMAEVGYGYSRQETINFASGYAVNVGIKQKAQTLGIDWFYGFMSRWPEVLNYHMPCLLMPFPSTITLKN